MEAQVRLEGGAAALAVAGNVIEEVPVEALGSEVRQGDHKSSESRSYKLYLNALKAEMTVLEQKLDRLEAQYVTAATHGRKDLSSTIDKDDLEDLAEEDLDDLEIQINANFNQQNSGSFPDSHSENDLREREVETESHDNLYSGHSVPESEHDRFEYYRGDKISEEQRDKTVFSARPSSRPLTSLRFLGCLSLFWISFPGVE